MKKEYERYFNSYYSIRPRDIEHSSTYLSAKRLLHDIIEQVINDEIHWISWRDDAKYFILINMLHFVMHPIYEVDKYDRMSDVFKKYREQIFEDVRRLVIASSEIATKRELSYVSGTSVAIALGSMVEELQTSNIQIWGPEEDEHHVR